MREDFKCIIRGNEWYYNSEERYIYRNGCRYKPMRFSFYKTFENYCRREEFNI